MKEQEATDVKYLEVNLLPYPGTFEDATKYEKEIVSKKEGDKNGNLI